MSDEYVSNATKAARECELTDEAFAALMASHNSGDFESAHCNGDDALVELVRRLGYIKTADAWEALGKWYA